MSTSASEHADNLKAMARLVSAVAKKYPSAKVGRVWKDGPDVLVVERGEIEPTHVDAVAGDYSPELVRYVEVSIGTGDEREVIRVYERRDFPQSTYAVLERLRKTRPEIYAAIVEEAGK